MLTANISHSTLRRVWVLSGMRHSLGDGFRGYIDIVTESYHRDTLETAIATVPLEMMAITFWGTPDHVVAELRALGEAGLRHVVPVMTSAVVSREAATYSMEAMTGIAQALCSGE